MKVAVIGLENRGAVMAALLRTGGAEVYIYDEDPNRSQAIYDNGIDLTINGKTISARDFRVLETLDYIGTAEMIVLTARSAKTEQIANKLAGAMKEDSILLSLQDGKASAEILAASISKDKIVVGSLFCTARTTDYNHVTACGASDAILKMGALEKSRSLDKKVSPLKKILQKAGMKVSSNENAEYCKWRETIYRCGTEPVPALVPLALGTVGADENGQWLMQHLWKEGCNVAKQYGVDNLWEELQKEMDNVSSCYKDCFPPMAEDTELIKRQTEVGYLNSVVIDQAKAKGVPTPVNQVVLRLLLLKQTHYKELGLK